MKITEVVAALVWDKEKFMICQRPETKSCPLLWEFVGGKVEQGEGKEQALVRECKEELGIIVAVDRFFADVTYSYPDIEVHLNVFEARIISGTPKKLEHNDIRWIGCDEIANYKFCPADVLVLEKIREKCSLKNNNLKSY